VCSVYVLRDDGRLELFATEGLNRGEMSRFMLQLLMESQHRVTRFNLTSSIELTAARTLSIQKTPEILETLNGRYLGENARPLSPTALNSLLECSLRFYFHYVAGLREPDEVSEDIDGAMLGNFFHHSAQFIYTSILLRKAARPSDQDAVLAAIQAETVNGELQAKTLRGTIDAADLEPWLKNAHSIEQVVDLFFKRDFFRLQDHEETPEYNGEQLVRRTIVTGFLKTLLKIDQARAPFELLGLELGVLGEIEGQEGRPVRFGGTIDRLDRKDGILRILDYKTGGIPKTPADLASLFSDEPNRAAYVFQILLYASILQGKQPDADITPELLYIHKAAASDYVSEIAFGSQKNKQAITSFKPFETDFKAQLNNLIINLFNPELPFSQTPYPEKCAYCDYKNLCRR
jgi:ATP-dependent helicase/DNAse subunit B